MRRSSPFKICLLRVGSCTDLEISFLSKSSYQLGFILNLSTYKLLIRRVCEHLKGRWSDKKHSYPCLGDKWPADGHFITRVCSRAWSSAVASEQSLGAGQCELCWAGSLVSHREQQRVCCRLQDFIRSDTTLVPATGTVTQLGKVRCVWRREILWPVNWSVAQGMVPRPEPKGCSPSSFSASSWCFSALQQLCECRELCAASLGCRHSSQRAFPKSLQQSWKQARDIQWWQVTNPRLWEGKEEIRYYFGPLCQPPQVILSSQTR